MQYSMSDQDKINQGFSNLMNRIFPAGDELQEGEETPFVKDKEPDEIEIQRQRNRVINWGFEDLQLSGENVESVYLSRLALFRKMFGEQMNEDTFIVEEEFRYNKDLERKLPPVLRQKLTIYFTYLEGKKHNKPSDKWKPLYDGLIDLKLIEGNEETFFRVMEEHHLPGSSKKILWKGAKTAGVYFCDFYKFNIPDFNKCFTHISGKPFDHKNREKTDPEKKFSDLLNNTHI